MSHPEPTAATNPDTAALAGPLAEYAAAIAKVRQLVDAGLVTPEALCFQPPVAAAGPAAGPAATLVPGERITIADLATKTLDGLKGGTKKTYRSYIRFLAEGWPLDVPPEEKVYPGLGEKWADEVLPSHLEEALRHIESRPLDGAATRAANREAAGREVRTGTASGAKYNAVGAWRRMFKVAVKDRHLAKAFDPSQEIAKPKRSDGTRMAFEQFQLDDVWAVATGTGDEPVLDAHVLETILIAGARQEGILNLTLGAGPRRVHHPARREVRQGRPPAGARLVSREAARPRGRPGCGPARRRRLPLPPVRPPARGSHRQPPLRLPLRGPHPGPPALGGQGAGHRPHRAPPRHHGGRAGVQPRGVGGLARHEPEGVNGRYTVARPKEVAAAVVALYGGDHPWLHREPRPRTD
jgi:hypothetical protein